MLRGPTYYLVKPQDPNLLHTYCANQLKRWNSQSLRRQDLEKFKQSFFQGSLSTEEKNTRETKPNNYWYTSMSHNVMWLKISGFWLDILFLQEILTLNIWNTFLTEQEEGQTYKRDVLLVLQQIKQSYQANIRKPICWGIVGYFSPNNFLFIHPKCLLSLLAFIL